MNQRYYNLEQPSLVKTIAILTLINGIVNIFWGLVVTASVVLGTFFFGLICAPLTILPTILGVFEIIYALKLLSNPPQPVQPSQAIAILEILCILAGNVFSMIVGILALVFYNDPQVKVYFAELNGTPLPANTPPADPPAPPSAPELAPATDSATPADPKKPRQRKIASDETSSTSES